jgi:hypothetical protein
VLEPSAGILGHLPKSIWESHKPREIQFAAAESPEESVLFSRYPSRYIMRSKSVAQGGKPGFSLLFEVESDGIRALNNSPSH